MQEVEEGDGYSDDDLDALPIDTFHELQENAIRSTQHIDSNERPILPLNPEQILPRSARLRNDFPYTAVNDNGSYNPHVQNHPQQASSDYGDFDSEMLDGEIFNAAEEHVVITGREGGLVGRPIGESTQREQWRQHRFGPPQPLLYEGNQQRPILQETSMRDSPKDYDTSGYNNNDQKLLLLKKGYQTGFQHGNGFAQSQSQDSATMEKLQAQVQEVLPYSTNQTTALILW